MTEPSTGTIPDPPVLRVRDLTVRYPGRQHGLFGARTSVLAVDDVNLDVGPSEVVGLVGESGSGKSSTARAVMGLEDRADGQVEVLGHNILHMPERRLRPLRPRFQMVFQDPYGSLDPRQSVIRIVGEPLRGEARSRVRETVIESLEAVGLTARDADKYPHQFSGGQRQRIAIARALVTRPHLIVADEAVSALDVSVQAQVLNLMKDVQADLSASFLFISHDLAVVDYMCGRVIVMFAGRIVEEGTGQEVLRDPAHPYTRELIDAMPVLGRRRRGRLTEERSAPYASVPANRNRGCAYARRCPIAVQRCLDEAPPLRRVGYRAAACHLAWT